MTEKEKALYEELSKRIGEMGIHNFMSHLKKHIGDEETYDTIKTFLDACDN